MDLVKDKCWRWEWMPLRVEGPNSNATLGPDIVDDKSWSKCHLSCRCLGHPIEVRKRERMGQK